jgi:hypothetical protein
VLKEKKVPTKHIFSKADIQNTEEVKTFPDKQKLSKLITTTTISQKLVKGGSYAEMKGH